MTPSNPYDLPTLAARLEALGYGTPGNDLDATLHWVLTDLDILRPLARMESAQNTAD